MNVYAHVAQIHTTKLRPVEEKVEEGDFKQIESDLRIGIKGIQN